ncbi:hypothetical protein SAMN05444392_101836 [Seinonella peptonophila]|uniref:Uncharacterized protein n=1 Tax=Seinonella peptonophila TaxID=112248 RepID=A0A1M4U653_9BACL|nr:hypothetical protein [Seinonella peptonophila]SHE52311.1 hypothetical protein SAMN05444392_101836 [Seinonella peptonophila]
MNRWIYWAKLYESKFQANCLAARIQEDWWLLGSDHPSKVEVYRSYRGRYGVRYMWRHEKINE